jgi:hypothetical protein
VKCVVPVVIGSLLGRITGDLVVAGNTGPDVPSTSTTTLSQERVGPDNNPFVAGKI